MSSTGANKPIDGIFEALADRRRAAEKAVRERIARGRDAGELAAYADVDALTGS